MNYIPSTLHLGKFIARIWLQNAATSQTTNFNSANPSTTVLSISSEGQKIRSQAFNNSNVTVPFSAANVVKYWDAYLYSSNAPLLPSSFTQIGGGNSGIGPVQFTIDLSSFPNLNALCNFTGCTYNKVICNCSAAATMLIRSATIQGGTLDLSQCITGVISGSSTFCLGLIVPVTNSVMTSFSLPEHRLVNVDLLLPSYPNLTTLNFNTGVLVAGFNNVDISLLPNITTINFGLTGIKTLIVGTNTFTKLTTVTLVAGRFTARTLLGDVGSFGTLLTMLTRALLLNSIDLSNNGLTEAEQEQLLDLFTSSAASRPTTAKTLNIGGQTIGASYPVLYNNGANNTPLAASNAPLTTLALRAKVASLVANNAWTITYNKVIGMTVTKLTDTTIRATYGGVTNIDVWVIGDLVTMTLSQTNGLPNGTYTVLAGSGKVWDFTAPSSLATFTAATGQAAFDK